MGYDAPFGLRWGMTLEEFQALQLPIAEQTERADMGLILLKTKTVPHPPPDTNHMIVVFNKEAGAGLVKVMWTSNFIEEDPSGRKGRELYDDIKKTLTNRVGQPPNSVAERTFERVYSKSSEFYECLKYGEECGRWVAIWQAAPGGDTCVEVKGLSHGSGVAQVQYEDLAFDQIKERFQQREDERRQRERESRQKAF